VGAQDVADGDGPRDIRAELMDEAFEDGELARDNIISEALIAPMLRFGFTVASVGYNLGYGVASLTAPIVVRTAGNVIFLGVLGVHIWRLYRVIGGRSE